ncbi:MAG: Lon protease family protein [Bdellovibrio sp.]
MSISQLPSYLLSLQYPPQKFRFKSTEELEELKEPVGQTRAVEAMKFGTDIYSSGYNIYALGPPGTGKHQIVRQFLEKKAAAAPIPQDWVYVYNFQNASVPIVISFPPGEARKFQRQVQQFIEDLRTTIPSIFDSENYNSRRDSLINEFKEEQEKALANVQDKAKKENVFLLTSRGAFFFGQGDETGSLIDRDALAKLPEEEQKQITERLKKYNDELASIINNFPILEKQMRLKIKDLTREILSSAVESLIKDLKVSYSANTKISDYLNKMVQDVLENSHKFRNPLDEKFETAEGSGDNHLKRYEVNVIVDHSNQIGAPVVYEDNPTFMNLVGQIEHVAQMGALVTDFTLIKPGALHRANGGYLVLDAGKLLSSPHSWDGLKRSLRSEKIRIESLGQVFSMISTVTLKPEPIPLNCKVILIGDREIYRLLMRFDPDFTDLFKVSADFETELVRNDENELLFVRLLASIIRSNNLLHLDPSGAARVLEHSTRLTSDSERMSLSLELITSLLKEANLFAKEAGKTIVSAQDVQNALDAQVHRASRIYEKIMEEIERGTLLIDLEGENIGQINGLTVFEFGNLFFGHPARITAVARMGEGAVIDIEREIKMGGPIHSKGVLILSGFLKSRFAVDVPLSISASLAFEQTYGMVEGDSASLAELYALLSALAEIPIKQSIAVTGSVNQHGQVQPVGGINEKIEGFFDYCQRKGLTGRQGVIIPKANTKHLALRKNVIESVKKNEFFIYTVENIEDCFELLSGIPGKEIYEKIESRLRLFADRLNMYKRLNKPEKEQQEEGPHLIPPQPH